MSDVPVRRGPGRPPKNPTNKMPTSAVVTTSVPADSETDYHKPTHDARLQYYKVLEYVMLNMKASCLMGQYQNWYRALRQFHIMIIGYVQPDKLSGITMLFTEARQLLERQQQNSYVRDRLVQASMSVRIDELDHKLFEIEEKLHIAAKDMMLPTKVADILSFDEGAFLRDSDLGGQ